MYIRRIISKGGIELVVPENPHRPITESISGAIIFEDIPNCDIVFPGFGVWFGINYACVSGKALCEVLSIMRRGVE